MAIAEFTQAAMFQQLLLHKGPIMNAINGELPMNYYTTELELVDRGAVEDLSQVFIMGDATWIPTAGRVGQSLKLCFYSSATHSNTLTIPSEFAYAGRLFSVKKPEEASYRLMEYRKMIAVADAHKAHIDGTPENVWTVKILITTVHNKP